mmetsp:Transcript_46398/g.145165  ORF Transcript_46398/g.145165 Transcript_46398/m.145165 type:complete len:433 (-) Transcript_46398:4-1302(-)
MARALVLPELGEGVTGDGVTADVNVELLEDLVQEHDGRVHGVVLHGARDGDLADGHTQAEPLVVLDRVPRPVRVVKQVAGLDVAEAQREGLHHGGEVTANGLHVHLAALHRSHVRGPPLVDEVPALLADHHCEVVVAHGAVPARARRLLRVLLAVANHELRAEENLVRSRAEALPQALLELEVLAHELVDVSLEGRRASAVLRLLELLAGLHGEEEILGRLVDNDVVEGLLERHHGASHLVVVVRRVLHHRHVVLAEHRRQVLRRAPHLHGLGALEEVLNHRRRAPVVGSDAERLHIEVLGLDVRNLDGGVLYAVVNLDVGVQRAHGALKIAREHHQVGDDVAQRLAVQLQPNNANGKDRQDRVDRQPQHGADDAAALGHLAFPSPGVPQALPLARTIRLLGAAAMTSLQARTGRDAMPDNTKLVLRTSHCS